jgi:hypothetical protein
MSTSPRKVTCRVAVTVGSAQGFSGIGDRSIAKGKCGGRELFVQLDVTIRQNVQVRPYRYLGPLLKRLPTPSACQCCNTVHLTPPRYLPPVAREMSALRHGWVRITAIPRFWRCSPEEERGLFRDVPVTPGEPGPPFVVACQLVGAESLADVISTVLASMNSSST